METLLVTVAFVVVVLLVLVEEANEVVDAFVVVLLLVLVDVTIVVEVVF